MSKKVSKMVDNIDLKHLENIEPVENIRDDVSLDRIKAKAMGVVFEEKRKKNKRSWYRLVIVPAAALIMLMSLTVFAFNSNPSLREFFGDKLPFISEKIQPIQKSHTQKGITFTVEDAVIDETSGLIAFSFVKTDGTAFDENIAVGDIKLSTGDGYGFSRRSLLTDFNKKLLYYIDVNNNGSLYGKKLNITTENLVIKSSGEKQLDIDLFELYTNNPNKFNVRHSTLTDSDGPAYDFQITPILFDQNEIDYRINPLPEIPQYGLLGVVYIEGKVIILTELDRPKDTSSSEADIYNLMDTRTGEIIRSKQTTKYNYRGSNTQVAEIIFEVPESESLKYLKPVVSYTLKEIDVEQTWSVDFKLKKNLELIKLTPDRTVEYDRGGENHVITFDEISISMLGIRVKSFSVNKATGSARWPRFEESYLLMKDGTTVKLENNSTTSLENDGYAITNFKIEGFLDVESIEELNISGQRFPIN